MTASSDHDTPTPGEISHRVFLSHSSKDRDAADRLCELLESRGIVCWIAPRDVTPGENYGSQIVHGLQDSDDLVILLSPDSLKSRHVASEVARAFEKGKEIYPLRMVEDVWPTEELALFVSSAHWVEAWDKELPEVADDLVRAIKNKARGKSRRPYPGLGTGADSKQRSCLPVALLILLCAALAVLIPFWLVLRDPERGDQLVRCLPASLQGAVNRMRGHTPGSTPAALATNPRLAEKPPGDPPREPPFGKRLWQSLSPAIDFIWIEALGIWVSKYEVTNKQYLRFRKDHLSGRFQGERLDGNPQPVVKVSHGDARSFATWMTENDDQAGNIPEAGWHYRLPLEKEWLAFAACGDERQYPWGDEWPPTQGNYADKTLADRPWATSYIENYNDTFRVTCAVYESGKNAWGLYGVGGNVWEWMLERMAGQAVVRGAAWDRAVPEHLACSIRVQYDPTEQSPAIGFRLVFAPPVSDRMLLPPHMRPGLLRDPARGERRPGGPGPGREDRMRRRP